MLVVGVERLGRWLYTGWYVSPFSFPTFSPRCLPSASASASASASDCASASARLPATLPWWTGGLADWLVSRRRAASSPRYGSHRPPGRHCAVVHSQIAIPCPHPSVTGFRPARQDRIGFGTSAIEGTLCRLSEHCRLLYTVVVTWYCWRRYLRCATNLLLAQAAAHPTNPPAHQPSCLRAANAVVTHARPAP